MAGKRPSDGAGNSMAQTFKNPVTFKECFAAFSKFGDTKSDGTTISLSQSDKWMKQSKVIDGKTITTTDTAIFFKKLKQPKLTFDDYEKFLTDLVTNKKLNIEEIKRQMGACGAPGVSSTVAGNKISSTVERLTDPSKYTGSHRERFDESGKGKGIEGRRDVAEQSGDAYNIFNDIESLPEEVEETLNQIIRDPPCRLSFPRGCPFVLLQSIGTIDKEDSVDVHTGDENYIQVEVEIKADEPKLTKSVNFEDETKVTENKKEKGKVVKSETSDSDNYDDDDSIKEDHEEYVEEEEDWDNLDQDSDDYCSSS